MVQSEKMYKKFLLPFLVSAMYLFLYVPIIILVLFSFNNNQFTYSWSGFTLQWYRNLFANHEVWSALRHSLIVATSSVLLSLVLGVSFVFYSSGKYLEKFSLLFYANLAVPEIVLGIGMLSFFSFFSIPIGLTTLIAGHTIIGFGYVVPIIEAQFAQVDAKFTEASMDLGATQTQTLSHVIMPMLLPALISAGLLVFIISFDDFIIAFFCAGASAQTLPLYIFSMIRAGASPVVSALSCVLLAVSSLLVLLFSSLQVKKIGGGK